MTSQAEKAQSSRKENSRVLNSIGLNFRGTWVAVSMMLEVHGDDVRKPTQGKEGSNAGLDAIS